MKSQLRENPNNLPPEVIHEILSWLPVKYLRHFECVSRAWRSLISDPKFITTHFIKAIKDKGRLLCQGQSVMFTDAAHNGLHSIHLDEFLDHNYRDDQKLVSAIEHEYVYSEVSGIWVSLLCSCNDLLLCKLCDSRLYLVNPSTKETKKVPEIPKEGKYRSSINLYGIGFDHSTYEHKVVKGLYTKHNRLINLLIGDFDEEVVFSVYTLKTDSWRKIEGSFRYRFYASQQGIMLNGDLHWFGERLEDQSRLIVSLALTGEERVREIPLPLEGDSVESTNRRRMKLGVFRQWLCITYYSYPRSETYNEFWVMMEYGVRESWTKMRVSIPYMKLSHSGFWTKSHDLMVFEEQLIMYNFNDESHRKINIRGIGKVGRVFTCLESLVSLKQRQRCNLKIEA